MVAREARLGGAGAATWLAVALLAFAGCRSKPVTLDRPDSAVLHSAEKATAELDLLGLEMRRDRLDILRPAFFFNPRSRRSATRYRDELEEHYAARLFHVFEWEANKSECLLASECGASFVGLLAKRRELLDMMAPRHRKIIVMINTMPRWLSSAADETAVVESWQGFQSHMPRDMARWRQLIAETAKFFRQFDGPQFYYEFWNEPDLEYWLDSTDDFLKLYTETAAVIRAEHPGARIGGPAVNAVDGRLEPQREPLVVELIRHAAARGAALDFVSWHHFSADTGAVERTRARLEGVAREAGLATMPEWMVTEWNAPRGVRDSPEAAATMAAQLLAFYRSGISLQTVAAWENFHPKSAPGDDYGLLHQSGAAKPAFRVHRWFSQAVYRSVGAAALVVDDASVFVSRRAGNEHCFDVLWWHLAHRPVVAVVLELMHEHGIGVDEIRARFGSLKTFEEKLEAKPTKGEDARLSWARQIYREAGRRQQTEHRHHIRIPGAEGLQLEAAEIVHDTLSPATVTASGDELSFTLRSNDVLRLSLCVR